jgi:hypothetical protein
MSCGIFYEICKEILAFCKLVLLNLSPRMNPDIKHMILRASSIFRWQEERAVDRMSAFLHHCRRLLPCKN